MLSILFIHSKHQTHEKNDLRGSPYHFPLGSSMLSMDARRRMHSQQQQQLRSSTNTRPTCTALFATNNKVMSRRSSLVTATTFAFGTAHCFLSPPLPAVAAKKEVDPALKGTKQDPSYEACVSQCMYDCTKPKGMEQKSRQECLPECKQKCATNKQQLMTGSPLVPK